LSPLALLRREVPAGEVHAPNIASAGLGNSATSTSTGHPARRDAWTLTEREDLGFVEPPLCDSVPL
jgi:hypothetical protein